MITYPLPQGEVELAYAGKAWVVICGDVAYGPFEGEHAIPVLWLRAHCPLSEQPDDDGIRRERCPERLWIEHRILKLEGWR